MPSIRLKEFAVTADQDQREESASWNEEPAPLEANPADVSEQRLDADNEAAGDTPVAEVGEANPADVYEQAQEVRSDDEGWSHP